MKPSRLFMFHLFCLTVILSFLANIARAEEVLKTMEAQTQPSQSASFIQFANDLLTVNVQDVPLKELLEEISRQGGLCVVGSGSLDDKITIDFIISPWMQRSSARSLIRWLPPTWAPFL